MNNWHIKYFNHGGEVLDFLNKIDKLGITPDKIKLVHFCVFYYHNQELQ